MGATERLTTDQAADRLGISVDAVRGRIKRGTLEHERQGNKVYVLLENDESTTSSDESTTNRDQPDDQARPDELVEVLTDQVEHLREQLAEEREARRRADTIIAQLAQSNEEQARTIRAIEAPDSPRDEQNEGQEAQAPGPQRSLLPRRVKLRERAISRVAERVEGCGVASLEGSSAGSALSTDCCTRTKTKNPS